MTRSLKVFLLVTDLGFIGYWLVTATQLLPPEWAYQDYSNPLLVSWNWSFLPLDGLASISGLLAVAFLRRRPGLAGALVLVSLALTASSGLNAISFWIFRGQFDPLWWGANGFLLVWPLPFLINRLRQLN